LAGDVSREIIIPDLESEARVKCKFGCGEEYTPGHYGKCRIVEKSLGKSNAEIEEEREGVHEEIEDVTDLIMNGGPGKGHYTPCKVVGGKRICKVKGCGKEALPKRGCCRKHQLERYRAESAKIALEKKTLELEKKHIRAQK
jgi:hypothetical protein